MEIKINRLKLDSVNRKSEMIYTIGKNVSIKAIKENEFHFFRIMKYEIIEGGERAVGKTNYSDHEIVTSYYTHFQIEYLSETTMSFELSTEDAVSSGW
ncbi:MAG: hypothetical protein H7282_08355 [Cytophagaceae bacterium]|nr:hypothetical protein [Cytophagaceae bacterium]